MRFLWAILNWLIDAIRRFLDKVFGEPFKDFPNELKLIDGTTLHRDQTRFLLFFKMPHTAQQVEALLQGLLPAPLAKRLVLESKNTPSGLAYQSKPINHTSHRYWIRSQDSRRIPKTTIQILETSTALNLERLGPVYRIPRPGRIGVLVCPLPHVLIVEPAPGTTPTQFDNILTQLDLEEKPGISQYLSGARYCVLMSNVMHTVATAQRLLLTQFRHNIKTVLFDYMPLHSPDLAAVTPRDQYYPDNSAMQCQHGQWNVRNIQAREAWGLPVPGGTPNTTGQGVLVCHIDTKGVDVDHPDLKAAKSTKPGLRDGYYFDFPNRPLPNPPASWTNIGQNGPTDSHGTFCAGVIAARMNNQPNLASNTQTAGTAEGIAGVANGCDLLSLRPMNGNWSEWASAVGYAAQNGAKVICTCFEVVLTSDVQAKTDEIIGHVVHGTGFLAGTGNKALLVAAAGNLNAARIDYPASNQDVLAVGASTGGALLPEDYRCKQYDWSPPPPASGYPAPGTAGTYGSNFGSQLSVVAPGVNIITTRIATVSGSTVYQEDINTSYSCQAGTSLAAPHVAGVAALLIERFPSLANNPQEVRNIIERTAEKVHDGETDVDTARYQYSEDPSHRNGRWNQYLGYGRINANRALTFADVFIRDSPTDDGTEPSAALGTGSVPGTVSDIVVRPATDETWQPNDEQHEARAGHVIQGENVCWVKVKNRGPADAINVRVRAAIWPRKTLNDVNAIGRKLSLNPISIPGVTIEPIPFAERNVNDMARDRLVIPSISAGGEKVVKFRIDPNTAYYAKRWADGAAEAYFDSEMGPGGTGTPRDMIIFAEVTSDNDHAYRDAPKKVDQDLVIRRNNLAQRKLYFD